MTLTFIIAFIVFIAAILGLTYGIRRILANTRGNRRRVSKYGEGPSHLTMDCPGFYKNVISPRLDRIEDRMSRIEKQLKPAETEHAWKKGVFKDHIEDESIFPLHYEPATARLQPEKSQSFEQQLVLAYNSALANEKDKAVFRERYQILRMGVSNVMERRRDSKLRPIFQTATDGDYYVIENQDRLLYEFMVVPRFDLTLQESNLIPGAIGEVFGRSAVDVNLRYRNYRMISPALFKREGDRWEQVRPGKLDLGAGE